MKTHTQSTHTPGPWHLGLRTGQRYVYGPLGEEIAGPSSFTAGPDETLANARLIASAPEILAALEQCAFVLGECSVYREKLSDLFPVKLAAARAAILKAKGEAP